MENEPGTVSEMVTAGVSEGFYSYKEAVYNLLGNFFSWLSTHQGLALIIILSVFGIMIYFSIRFRKYSKKIENKVSSQNIEIGKKDALIEEQKNKLAALQKNYPTSKGSYAKPCSTP